MSRQLLGFLGFLFLVHTSCKLQNSETNLVANEPQKEWLISDIKQIFNPPAPAQPTKMSQQEEKRMKKA